jgi:MFS family permease
VSNSDPLASSDSTEPPRLLPLLGWLVGSLFFFYAWILRVSPSVMVEELMRDFAVGGAILGNLSALYFYGYAGMQIPVGLLLDRFGPRRLMTVAATLVAVACLLFAWSDGLAGASVTRFLIGAGCAFSLVGAMAVAGQWFPRQRFALLAGLAMMFGMVGGVFGQAPLRLAVDASDWRTTMASVAVIGFGLALAAWLFVRDRRRGSGGVGVVIEGLRRVGANRETWLNAVAGLGSTGPLLAFAGLWGVPYLQAVYGIDRVAAGSVTSVTFIGWGVGAPLIGWLSDHVGNRRTPLIAGLILSTLSLVAILYVPGVPLWGVGVLCFGIGFGGSAQIVCFALVREHNPPQLSGTAIGMVNALVTGAGALFQPTVGWLLDLSWDGVLVDGARVYSIGAYDTAFAVLVVGCVVGILCAIAMRESSGYGRR